MFNNLASYLLGYTSQEPAAEAHAAETETRLTAVVADDDWVLVDRDSDSGSSDAGSCSSLESIPDAPDHHRRRRHPPSTTSTALLTRTSSTSSLPCANVEESWFLTPPPCFTSAGPVHMETSPLENLLIEHPSMSVYQHSSGSALTVAIMTPGRRRGSMPSSPAPSIRSEAVEDIEEVEEEEEMSEATDRLDERVAAPRRGTVDTLRQQERQCLKIKSAQKVSAYILEFI